MRDRSVRRARSLLASTAIALTCSGAAVAEVAQAAPLTADEVRAVVAQAVASAERLGLRATIAVTDAEGGVLAVFRMAGAPATSRVEGTLGQGLEGVPLPATLVAVSKAGSGALLSSSGNAFSTRTASFIVQQNFPPGVDFTPGGPLFGVQFSSLICTDFKRPPLPLGLSGDPGGLPLYRSGDVVGGVGVEGDGLYGVDPDPADADQSSEEQAALAGTIGFEAPASIRADNILADGIRLSYANAQPLGAGASLAAGDFVPLLPGLAPSVPRGAPPSSLVPTAIGGIAGRADPRFPVRAGSALGAADVARMLDQAARQTVVTRAAIRQPLGSAARVSIAVVDVDGSVLGFFQNEGAPNFGIDVSVQKARTANFFSGVGAAEDLSRAGLVGYLRDGIPLDGSVALTSRAVGFLAQPYFPPGIPGTDPGPFSLKTVDAPAGVDPEWSPFNTGLQFDLVQDALESALTGVIPTACSASVARVPNGITIFPGGVPVYKDGRLAGAIGVSGDGVDQDDLIASAGAAGFDAPVDRRCDRLTVRGVRLPYVKFPRHPNL